MSLSRESPNSRLNAIRKFLGQVPSGSTRLRLLRLEQQIAIPLGEWQPLINDDARSELALEIEQLLLDTASEQRRARMPFLLAWCDDAGQQRTVKELTVYLHQLPRDDTPEDTVRELDGSTSSQLAQTQRHLEAMMRMHLQAESHMFSTMASTIDRLSERCAQMETATGARHAELLEAKETILGLMHETAENELTPAQLKAFELAEKVVPGFMLWLQTHQRPPASKKPPNGHSNGTEGKAAA